MTLTERHIIRPTHPIFKRIKDFCHLSKNLYNYANFILREHYFAGFKLPTAYDLINRFVKESQRDYKALPAQSAQQVLMLLTQNWKSYLKALKAYKLKPSSFLARPKIPKFKPKDGVSIGVLTNQQTSFTKGRMTKIKFPKKANLKRLITKINPQTSRLKQVRLIPKTTCFIVEVVYEQTTHKLPQTHGIGIMGIDLGLNNFVTAIDNQSSPFIIKGGGVKSVNQWFNKLKAHYQAKAKTSNKRFWTKRLGKLALWRECKVNDFMHKASAYVVGHCLKKGISTIVIGKNDGWKQELKLGKRTNQNFTNIPYESFIEKLAYKCALVGITLHTTEERFTSKCDHLANEPMQHHEQYLGKRVKRGLFKSSIGKSLNADINGAIGILRKVFPDAVKTLRDSGVVFTPVKISLAF
ncbi:transposase [Helicobacter pylori]|nr:transposase [Helicobacter pylori]